MVTKERARPGTSTPCQNPRVAKRQDVSSSANCSSRRALGRSPWTAAGRAARRDRAAAAASVARRLVKRARVRPPAAAIRRPSSSWSGRLGRRRRGGRGGGGPRRAGRGPGSRRGCPHRALRSGSPSRPTRSARRGGTVALVRTAVTSPQSIAARAGPDVDGGQPQPGAAPGAVDPGHLVLAARRPGGAGRRPGGRGLQRRGSCGWPGPGRPPARRRSRKERCAPPRRSESVGPPAQPPRPGRAARPVSVVRRPAGRRRRSTRVPTTVARGGADPAARPAAASDSSRPSASVGSTEGRATVARARKRPGAISTPRLAVMTSSSSWASSNTTTSCSGSTAPPLARWAP